MSRSRRSRAALLVALAVACSPVAGCGDDPPDTPARAAGPSWSPASDPLDASGLIWATGSIVHFPDETTIDVGMPLEAYAVAGDSVFFTAGEPVDDDANTIGGRGFFEARRDGAVRQVADAVTNPMASPDGQYLVYLGTVSNRDRDDFGASPVQVVVVDLTAGREVVRTSEGMGDPDEDDLTALYEDSGIGIVSVDDTTAYVDGVGDHAVDLASGDVEEIDPDAEQPRRHDDPTSPDGEWSFTLTEQRRDPLVSADGTEVVPQTGTPRWSFLSWLDDEHAVGQAISGPGAGYQLTKRNHLQLMTCAVPSGECELIEGTIDEPLVLPGTDSY